MTVKRSAAEREVKQTFLRMKERIAFWKIEFFNINYDLNTLVITKKPKRNFLKKNLKYTELFQRSFKDLLIFSL